SRVQDEVFTEVLDLQGDGGLGKDLPLEARTLSDKPVVWRAPADLPDGQPLVRLANVAGLRLSGFHLDGEGRVEDLVQLRGSCPGLTLENVTLQNYRRCAVQLADCSGEEARPIALRQPRTLAPANKSAPEAALLFKEGQGIRHVQVSDGRFEGPMRAFVRIDGPVSDVAFQRNRFYQATDGLLCKAATPPPRRQLALVSNTFCD